MIDQIPSTGLPEIENIENDPVEILPEAKESSIQEVGAKREGPVKNHEQIEQNSPPKHEKREEKAVTFGAIEVVEDLQADLLTPQEREIYQHGFDTLKEITIGTDNIQRMVLTSPDITSGIVGLQPLVSMRTGEATLIFQAFDRAGIEFQNDYSFLEFSKESTDLKILINDRAAENILRMYQKELGISFPTSPLQKSQTISYVIQILNNTDIKQKHLAYGLLSGFPIEDCIHWVQHLNPDRNPIPSLKMVEDLDKQFGGISAEGLDKRTSAKPVSLLDPEEYSMSTSKNSYLPDTRDFLPTNAQAGAIEGFGLTWVSQLPISEATQNHLQKLLQINRELGLLEFINRQRRTFNVQDNIKAIRISRSLAEKRGLLSKIRIPNPFKSVSGFFTGD